MCRHHSRLVRKALNETHEIASFPYWPCWLVEVSNPINLSTFIASHLQVFRGMMILGLLPLIILWPWRCSYRGDDNGRLDQVRIFESRTHRELQVSMIINQLFATFPSSSLSLLSVLFKFPCAILLSHYYALVINLHPPRLDFFRLSARKARIWRRRICRSAIFDGAKCLRIGDDYHARCFSFFSFRQSFLWCDGLGN